ncbi:MAG: aminotransferase class V-fold PLP-dependent enzyme [Flavobacteriaceae bacterium]|jgi:selenocysteine lyase/cysteine desulfurase|nr:aminotransferase class V-fold PLP-dependent enzyme [Flavobacteriaceae bacterium]MDG2502883.1 aminotransferase class V-fold PLP-dependent enzyme [Flavobacteriaceae bacterium]
MYSEFLPLLTNCTYLNTAYVGPMSTKLAEYRREQDEHFIHTGGDFKVKAYDALEETHELIAHFFGALPKYSFVVPNFSFGIRQALALLPKNLNVLLLEEDYPSLCDAFVEKEFNINTIAQVSNLEQSIKARIEMGEIDILALSIVQYTSGLLIDIEFLKDLKKQFPKLLIIGDGTQFLGAHAFNFSEAPFDIVVGSGYKWLMAGFGNGVLLTSKHFYKISNATPEQLYDQVFTGHFNILATSSLRFAIEELNRNDFKALMEQKEQLSQEVKLRLIEHDFIDSWVGERKSHSSIFSLKGGEELYEKLQKQKIHCALRGSGVRVSFHFYNQLEELDRLVVVLNSLKVK